MLNFDYYSPTEYVFGKGTEERCGELAKKYGAKRVLLHYGGGSVVKSGLLDRVKASLQKAGVSFVELGGVQPNPIDTLVYKGIELARKETVDFIIAVGGGSVIDSSKAIALGVPYDGDFWDFYTDKTPEEALPVATILTIAAAGSEGSNSSVITKQDGLLKRSAGSDILRPKFSILNPELMYTLPAYQTACGVSDMMAHIFERYCSQTQDVDLTDHLCEALLKVIVQKAPVAIETPDDYDARANLMWAGTLAHVDLVGLGRQSDWGSHMIEHELSALYDVAHGAGLAVVFPAWMRYQYKHNVMLFAQLAERVWGCEMDFRHPEKTALEGIDRYEAFLRKLGLPTTFAELGAKEEDIPLMAEKCHMNNGDKMGYFNPLTKSDIEEVYRLACK